MEKLQNNKLTSITFFYLWFLLFGDFSCELELTGGWMRVGGDDIDWGAQ